MFFLQTHGSFCVHRRYAQAAFWTKVESPWTRLFFLKIKDRIHKVLPLLSLAVLNIPPSVGWTAWQSTSEQSKRFQVSRKLSYVLHYTTKCVAYVCRCLAVRLPDPFLECWQLK